MGLAAQWRECCSDYGANSQWTWIGYGTYRRFPYLAITRGMQTILRGLVSIFSEATETNEIVCIATTLVPACDHSTLYYCRGGSCAALLDIRGFPKV
jgi:hypothetical protein